MIDFLTYDTCNILSPITGNDNTQKLVSLLLPEIRKVIKPRYKRNDLQNVICNILINKLNDKIMKKSESLKFNVIADAVTKCLYTGELTNEYVEYLQYVESKKEQWHIDKEGTIAEIVYQIIHDEIIEYYAGNEIMPDIRNCQNAMRVIAESVKEWEELPCDAEGATKEQDKTMEEFLNEIINSVAECMSQNNQKKRIN